MSAIGLLIETVKACKVLEIACRLWIEGVIGLPLPLCPLPPFRRWICSSGHIDSWFARLVGAWTFVAGLGGTKEDPGQRQGKFVSASSEEIDKAGGGALLVTAAKGILRENGAGGLY